jgi:hypothetical protein
VIERLIIALIVASVVSWLIIWLLVHLGLLFIGAVGFIGWSWWRAKHRA